MYRDKYMLDILNPVVPEEKLHPNFKSLLRNPYHHETLLTIQEWTRDIHFSNAKSSSILPLTRNR